MEKEISGKEALKEKRKIKIKHQLDLWLFCALIGAVAGALVWVILKIMSLGMELIWTWIPGKISMPYYTLIVCTAGGVIIGVFRKIFGDYPEELETVMGKVKKEKRYDYSHMLVMIIAALLPLLQRRSGGRTYGDYCRIMLLGRRESEICKAAYKRVFTNRNCCFSQRIISCAAVRDLRSRGGFGRVPAK